MAEVKVYIVGKDRNVGAMVKALAREIAGFTPVRGATTPARLQSGFAARTLPWADARLGVH